VGKQRLDVAPPSKVESLLWPALLGKALAGLTRQPLGEGALDVELAVPGVPGAFLGGLDQGLVHRLVAGLHLLRGAHLGGRLVLVLMLLVSELVLVGMLGVLGMHQVLLHLLQLLLDGLRHGAAPRTAAAADPARDPAPARRAALAQLDLLPAMRLPPRPAPAR
jgi:hypothetical protein